MAGTREFCADTGHGRLTIERVRHVNGRREARLPTPRLAATASSTPSRRAQQAAFSPVSFFFTSLFLDGRCNITLRTLFPPACSPIGFRRSRIWRSTHQSLPKTCLPKPARRGPPWRGLAEAPNLLSLSVLRAQRASLWMALRDRAPPSRIGFERSSLPVPVVKQ